MAPISAVSALISLSLPTTGGENLALQKAQAEAATGVTDGDVLKGAHYEAAGATTESLVTRSRSGMVRRISASDDRSKLREITAGRVG